MAPSQPNSYPLIGPLSVYEVETLSQQLNQLLSDYREIAIDLSGVETCDSAGIQLLCSAMKTAKVRGVELQLLNPSASVLAAAQRIGIELRSIHATPIT